MSAAFRDVRVEAMARTLLGAPCRLAVSDELADVLDAAWPNRTADEVCDAIAAAARMLDARRRERRPLHRNLHGTRVG